MSTRNTLAAYRNSYTTLFNTMVVNPTKLPEIAAIVARIVRGKKRYQALEASTGVPWFFIGIIHYLEANNNFSRHLHNGDPLTARTRNVPAGRPTTGNPPFTFEQSALDAIRLKGFHQWKDWSIPGMLFQLERYNGFGYRNLRQPINTPYLWSYSNHYTKGKFQSDGVYNANLVSEQAGAAVILKEVMNATTVAKGAAVLLVMVGVFFCSIMQTISYVSS